MLKFDIPQRAKGTLVALLIGGSSACGGPTAAEEQKLTALRLGQPVPASSLFPKASTVCVLTPYQAKTGRWEIDRRLPMVDAADEGVWHIVLEQTDGVQAVAISRGTLDLIHKHNGPKNWVPPRGWTVGAACVPAAKAAFLRLQTVNRSYVALLSRSG
ncbi:hypothetical protein HJG53_01405 [Sphingomonas sp. ID1715]|uniref:hypothetical protein n=1 Tax=Sphingomonas sp. ID1715 TaxID=1656898 RepID=UPI0014876F30|nr:hypothetical protein [Sphingomonas sp. ID1715]NNM75563.1 hypothetical protein [Sphingomonas sp. ID1715]